MKDKILFVIAISLIIFADAIVYYVAPALGG